jgi:hypothetical protein
MEESKPLSECLNFLLESVFRLEDAREHFFVALQLSLQLVNELVLLVRFHVPFGSFHGLPHLADIASEQSLDRRASLPLRETDVSGTRSEAQARNGFGSMALTERPG